MSANESRPVTSEAASKAVEQTTASVPPVGDVWQWPVPSPATVARMKWTTGDLATWYERGVRDGRYLGAAAQAEVAKGVHSMETPGGRALYEQQRARADLFRERAVLLAASMGKVYVDHPGGPVDWDTGQPLVSRRREDHLRGVTKAMTFVERVRAHYGDERVAA